MRLYKAEYVETDIDDEWDEETSETFPDPEGWAEHCGWMWGEYKPFFPPSSRPIYRSRSAAQRRVDLINRWFGEGTAVVMEATVNWVPLAEAKEHRRLQRVAARVAKLRRLADEIEADA